MRIGLCSSAFGALAVAAAMPVVAQAQSPAVQFRVPAGPLQTALPLFATQSGEQILYSTDLVAGRQSAGVSGALRTDQALTTLLQGTGLRARRTSPNTLVVYDPDARADATDEAVEIEDVVVTGSLIRGVADGPSPVVTVTRDEMDRNGRATVAQLLASLPQNFGGTANEAARPGPSVPAAPPRRPRPIDRASCAGPKASVARAGGPQARRPLRRWRALPCGGQVAAGVEGVLYTQTQPSEIAGVDLGETEIDVGARGDQAARDPPRFLAGPGLAHGGAAIDADRQGIEAAFRMGDRGQGLRRDAGRALGGKGEDTWRSTPTFAF